MKKYDIAIIGGGASGLMAAISAKKENSRLSVAIIEGKDRVGKKLLLTGNGCCNITNNNISPECYFGDRELFEKIYSQFDLAKTCRFFEETGIEMISDEDFKIYPMSKQAGSVVDQLRFKAEELNITTLTDTKVDKIIKKSGFTLINNGEDISCRAVIVCTGGKSYTKTGSDGSGYTLLTGLGHTVTKLYPALTPVTTEMTKIRPLTGIKVEGEVSITEKGRKTAFKGEILFTDYGISGPPVLQISRHFSVDNCKKIILDLLPGLNREKIREIIENRYKIFAKRKAEELLTGFTNKRLGQTVVKCSGIPLSTPISELSPENIDAIVENIKHFELNVTGTKGWDRAQVTAGGINTEEFDKKTLQSKKINGLFAAGEVLNVDGMCGGYNLQWAWSSGAVAGQNAAKSLKT